MGKVERCRWLTDPDTGAKYHVPGCWGGVHDPRGCYCRRSKDSEEAYELGEQDDEIERLEDRVKALEEKLEALSPASKQEAR